MTAAAGSARAWPPRVMVLWCPDWPVLAHAREHRLPDRAPVLLIDRGEIVACSAAARHDGVRRGMRLRQAQHRSPDARMLRYDPSLDARVFEPVVAGLEALFAGVQLMRPGVCAVRARGAARYYGGERAAAMALLAVASGLGVPATVGVADGIFVAERAARLVNGEPSPEPERSDVPTPPGQRVAIVPPGGGSAFLAPLPVAVLGEPQLATLLPRLGIRTLGQFAALPADDVADRFGAAGARLHAMASGRDPAELVPRVRPSDFDAVVDFEPPLERAEQVAFGIRSAAERFVGGLIAERLVATAIRVEIEGEPGAGVASRPSERVWLHPRSFTVPEIVDRVRWQLHGSLGVSPGSGPGSARDASPHALQAAVARVRIVPETVDAAVHHERGLWGTGPDEGVHSVLSRVQSMVGHRGVLTGVRVGGRSPADAQLLVPWGDRPVVERDVSRPWPGALPTPAPATVYEHPLSVVVTDAAGRGVEVSERGLVSAAPAEIVPATGPSRRIAAWAGPWPLRERWWDERQARSVHRFQAVDRAGDAWLLVLDQHGWWAEARYD